MKFRYTGWLAALLLAATMNVATPAAAAVVARDQGCRMRVDQPPRTQCETAEPRSTAWLEQPRTARRPMESDSPRVLPALDGALFQRPPPVLPRS